jgi:hypothetical protein
MVPRTDGDTAAVAALVDGIFHLARRGSPDLQRLPPFGALMSVPTVEPELAAQAEYFPVAVHKFILLSLCTFGIYEAYWCYQMWKRVLVRTSKPLSPVWRAFFAPIWIFSLFRQIHDRAVETSIPATWSAYALGAFYVLLTLSWRLPGAWWLIAFGSFVPFIPVLQTVRAINARSRTTESPNESYNRGEVATIVVGAVLLVVVVLGTIYPPRS